MSNIILFSTTQYEYGNHVEEQLSKAGHKVHRIPDKLPTQHITQLTRLIKPPVGVVAYYGAIIPQKAIELFPKGIINIHPSLLPKYRGPSPVATAILNGETITGVTIFKIDAQIDHGPILAQKKVEIRPTDTREKLLKKLFIQGANLLVTILPDYLNSQLQATPQDESHATYTKKLTRDDGQINWDWPDEYIERRIRALNPWPGTWGIIKGKRVLIHQAKLTPEGKLIIEEFQVAGKGRVKGSWDKTQFLAYLS